MSEISGERIDQAIREACPDFIVTRWAIAIETVEPDNEATGIYTDWSSTTWQAAGLAAALTASIHTALETLMNGDAG